MSWLTQPANSRCKAPKSRSAASDSGEGRAGRPAARPDRHAALRGDGLEARSRKRGYRLIWPTTRAVTASPTRRPSASAYEYSDLVGGPRCRCSTTTGSSGRRWSGSSMGAAHRDGLRARRIPERVSALVLITPAYDGTRRESDSRAWDALADGLERGGVEGFVEAWQPARLTERWRETGHAGHAPAAGAPPRTPRRWPTRCASCRARAPFEALDALESLDVPVLVVACRDESDPDAPAARSARSTRAGCPAPSWSSRRRASRRSPGRAGSSRRRSPTSWPRYS